MVSSLLLPPRHVPAEANGPVPDPNRGTPRVLLGLCPAAGPGPVSEERPLLWRTVLTQEDGDSADGPIPLLNGSDPTSAGWHRALHVGRRTQTGSAQNSDGAGDVFMALTFLLPAPGCFYGLTSVSVSVCPVHKF